MSLQIVESEVYRFLSSANPEVLCIKGKWGVGKTYGWRSFLAKAKRNQTLNLQKYSYVSLFGLTSLDNLRYAIFENTVSGENIGRDPDAATFSDLVTDKDNARKLGWLVEAVGGLFNRKGVADLFARSAFLLVRNQLICLDDLERAGSALGPREVLGLASQLKEERKCKIVLLLNDEEHDEKREFERQLEKVADLTLVFDLTPDEAVKIGLKISGKATPLVGPCTTALGLTNIRVIKKIERLAERLIDLLNGYETTIIEESIATLALASWSVQQPKIAPSLDFIRKYNQIAITMRAGREQVDADTARFRDQIADYPYRGANVLDHAIIDGAENGYFVEDDIRVAADRIACERKESSGDLEFYRTWKDLYHGSLATDDDEFLDKLYSSAMNEAGIINSLDMNGTISLLRESGRGEQASELIERFISANESRGIDFFNFQNHHFIRREDLDADLAAGFAQKRLSFGEEKDPLEVLRVVGKRGGWTDSDAMLLGKQSATDFVAMFEALRGEELRPAIEMVLALSNSAHPARGAIERASSDALNIIAAKSELRRRKILGLGFVLDAAQSEPPAPSPNGGS